MGPRATERRRQRRAERAAAAHDPSAPPLGDYIRRQARALARLKAAPPPELEALEPEPPPALEPDDDSPLADPLPDWLTEDDEAFLAAVSRDSNRKLQALLRAADRNLLLADGSDLPDVPDDVSDDQIDELTRTIRSTNHSLTRERPSHVEA